MIDKQMFFNQMHIRENFHLGIVKSLLFIFYTYFHFNYKVYNTNHYFTCCNFTQFFKISM